MNILILESDRLLNKAVSAGLKSSGYKVFSYFNEKEVREIPANVAVDIIISNPEMMQTQRLDFLDPIQNKLKFNSSIIIISAYDYEQTDLSLYNFNCVAFFKKPVDPDLILEHVKQIERRQNKE